MKKILWALALMNAMTFADVHPALKEAIDSTFCNFIYLPRALK